MSESTHYQLVGEFHDTFGHPKKNELYVDCFTSEPKLVPFRISLMKEELSEFKTAFDNNDYVEMCDALCDLSYVVCGAGHALGMNLDNLMKQMNVDITTPDNLSKVNTNMSYDDRTMINNSYELIRRSLDNFCLAAADQDLMKMATCLVLIMKDVYNLGHNINFNMDKSFREVHRSNMTKVCSNMEDANASVEFYKVSGRNTVSMRPKGKYYVIYDTETSKILKNHKWEMPNIKQFF